MENHKIVCYFTAIALNKQEKICGKNFYPQSKTIVFELNKYIIIFV